MLYAVIIHKHQCPVEDFAVIGHVGYLLHMIQSSTRSGGLQHYTSGIVTGYGLFTLINLKYRPGQIPEPHIQSNADSYPPG
jgi:hypothetical protein